MTKLKVRPGYYYINAHNIFYININGKLTREEILMSDGHKNAPLSSITYSSSIYREIVSIVFLISSLNDLEPSCLITVMPTLTPSAERKFDLNPSPSLVHKKVY